jgi:hypothetical protein
MPLQLKTKAKMPDSRIPICAGGRLAEGRDKDTKPVFVDRESYLFLEIFHRWLIKAGEIEVMEMLPDPEHLFWKESNGRHSFELRTLIVPRS